MRNPDAALLSGGINIPSEVLLKATGEPVFKAQSTRCAQRLSYKRKSKSSKSGSKSEIAEIGRKSAEIGRKSGQPDLSLV
jgi:hypothetical protein